MLGAQSGGMSVAEQTGNEWCKLFVDGDLCDPEYPFTPGMVAGAEEISLVSFGNLLIESVVADPDLPGRFIVHASKRG